MWPSSAYPSLIRSIALDRPPQLILPIQCRGKGTRLLHPHPYTYYGAVRPNCKAFIETRSKFQQ